jgi:hypothetical protein
MSSAALSQYKNNGGVLPNAMNHTEMKIYIPKVKISKYFKTKY